MAVKVAVFLFLQKYESLLFPWIHFFPTSFHSERGGEAQIFSKTFFWGKNNASPSLQNTKWKNECKETKKHPYIGSNMPE